jgi:transcriptional regulator with XRE-family HTH domain
MNKQLPIKVGRIIREARMRKGLTQKELAQKMGTYQPIISRLEGGKDLPTLSFMRRMADSYNTELLPPIFKFLKQHGNK